MPKAIDIVGHISNRKTGERLSVVNFIPGGAEPRRWASVQILGVEQVQSIQLSEWEFIPGTIVLAYCEIDYLMLRPNTTYKFVPIEGCEKCAVKLAKYEEAHA